MDRGASGLRSLPFGVLAAFLDKSLALRRYSLSANVKKIGIVARSIASLHRAFQDVHFCYLFYEPKRRVLLRESFNVPRCPRLGTFFHRGWRFEDESCSGQSCQS